MPRPKPEVIDKAIRAMKRAADYEYFFDRLTSPDWIEPLFEAGMFAAPLAPVPKDQFMRFPVWPQSRYLARMSSRAPEAVLKIILALPPTENVRIHEDIVDAALAMPARLAARIVPKAISWLESRYQLLLPQKLGELIGHLARGGQVGVALSLARALFQPVVEQEEETITVEGETHHLSREPKARFDPHYYGEILKKRVPDLVAAGGEDAVKLFADLLDEALQLSRRREEGERRADYSYIWRPAVEDHEQNRSHTVAHLLVSAVRDAVEQLASNDPTAVPRLVEALEARQWPIFRRIGLHLLRLAPKSTATLVSARLTDHDLFEDVSVRHEYALLLGERFGGLDAGDRMKILGWITTGPNLEQFKTTTERWTGKIPTGAQVEAYGRSWRLDRLALIRRTLPPEWKERYLEWARELGEPEHPEFPSYSTGTWVGPTSPKSGDELRSMSVGEVEEFLKSWQPSGGSTSSSREGLGRVLSGLVASEPQRFASESERFLGLDPTYVRALLSGFRDAVTANRSFSWAEVMSVCKWVVAQPRDIVVQREGSRPQEHWEEDPHWGWTRKTIADLMASGFASGPSEIPFELRDVVWEVLRPLTDDPDPTPEDEAQDGPSGMDPMTLSINSTRGEAMHAVIQYSVWVHRHTSPEAPEGGESQSGFDGISRVREVLEEHLDLTREPSLAIRSVYGRWFPQLLLLDREWATARIDRIFPSDEALQDYWAAAWGTYVVVCRPYDETFEVLQSIYAQAIERIGRTRPRWRELADSEEKLSEHLMVWYWQGRLSLERADVMLRRFYEKAPPRVRAHALTFIGMNLRDTTGTIPSEILERLKRLWAWRLREVQAGENAATLAKELSAFGWWFVSGRFDDVWALTELISALRVARTINPDHLVLERLAAVARALPGGAIEALRLLIEGDTEGWKILAWRDEVRAILTVAISGDDASASEAAVALIHQIGARGYRELRDLIPRRH